MKILTYRLGAYSTNCYLMFDEQTKQACLIDPGEYDTRIEEAITRHELAVEYIILTHGHFDHLLGVSEFKERTGAKIVAHELEAEYLEDPAKSLTRMAGGEKIHADMLVKDGDVLTVGSIELKVMHTPGHTKGSCCLICETIADEPIIFTGDTLFKDGIGRYDLYGGDYNILVSSLEKLSKLGSNYKIYPGHGGVSTLGEEVGGQ